MDFFLRQPVMTLFPVMARHRRLMQTFTAPQAKAVAEAARAAAGWHPTTRATRQHRTTRAPARPRRACRALGMPANGPGAHREQH